MGSNIKIGDKVVLLSTGKEKIVSAITYTITDTNGLNPLCVTEKDLLPHIDKTETKFKVGDKIRVCDPNLSCYDFVGYVKKIKDGLIFGTDNNGIDFTAKESCLELVQTVEQMEEANLRQWQSELEKLNKIELDKMQHTETAMDWVKYEAQLAHDIAVKIVGNDIRCPKDIGNYAVSIAQAVVDGLKKK